MAKKKIIPFSRANRDIYETFALDWQDYVNGGKLPEKAGADLKYVLRLQKDRLESRKIEQHCELLSKKEAGGYQGGTCRRWSDRKYLGEQHVLPCRVIREMQKNGRSFYKSRRNASLYVSQLDAGSSVGTGNEAYNCPNCGAVATVKQLAAGCPYCGTYFKNTDLFPNISGYMFLERYGLEKFRIWEILLCWPLGSGLMAFEISILGQYMAQGEKIYYIVFSGFLMGLMLLLLYKMGKSMAMLTATIGSRRRFEKKMGQYDRNFSYDYFTEKAARQAEMIFFSQDPSSLPVYEGADLSGKTDDILDISYLGTAALKHLSMDGTMCSVETELYADITRDCGKKISGRREIIHMELKRDISREIDISASPLKVQCRSCGGSFNAVQEKTCPYCGSSYANDYSDWTVTSISCRRISRLRSVLCVPGLALLFALIPLGIMAAIYLWPLGLIAYMVKKKKNSTGR